MSISWLNDDFIKSLSSSTGDVNAAETLPPLCYTDPEFFEFEKEAIFNREWLCAGRLLCRIADRRADRRRAQSRRHFEGHDGGVSASRGARGRWLRQRAIVPLSLSPLDLFAGWEFGKRA